MSDSLYSNFDHTFDEETRKELLEGPPGNKYQHAAWDFCGWVSKTEDGKFQEEIWRYHHVVEVLKADTIEELIKEAINKYGND